MVRSIPLRGTPSAHRDKASQPSSSRFIRNLIRAPYVHHRFIYRLVTVSPNRKHREMEILSRYLTTLYRLLGKSHQLCHWISYERSQAIDPFGIQCSKANRKKEKSAEKSKKILVSSVRRSVTTSILSVLIIRSESRPIEMT